MDANRCDRMRPPISVNFLWSQLHQWLQKRANTQLQPAVIPYRVENEVILINTWLDPCCHGFSQRGRLSILNHVNTTKENLEIMKHITWGASTLIITKSNCYPKKFKVLCLRVIQTKTVQAELFTKNRKRTLGSFLWRSLILVLTNLVARGIFSDQKRISLQYHSDCIPSLMVIDIGFCETLEKWKLSDNHFSCSTTWLLHVSNVTVLTYTMDPQAPIHIVGEFISLFESSV